jgi:hypothetical protein
LRVLPGSTMSGLPCARAVAAVRRRRRRTDTASSMA